MNDPARLVAAAQALIRVPSPSGHEGQAVTVCRRMLEDLGYDEVRVDGTGNVVAVIRGGQPGPRVLFSGHIDVVPEGDPALWTHDPYGGEIAGGRLYGRGASDMKGALAAMACGLAGLIPEKADLAGEIVLAAVVCEEVFEGIALGHVLDARPPELVVIGEATELELAIGQRGRAEVVVETFGTSVHSSNPEAGVNALDGFLALAAELRRLELPADPAVGRAILEPVDVISRPWPGASVLPALCRSTWDRRLLPGETPADVLAPIEEAIRRVQTADPRIRARATLAAATVRTHTGNELSAERFFPGWIVGEDAAHVVRARAALSAAGLPDRTRVYGFCTDGSESGGKRGLPTLGFGPSRENLAHVADEYVEVEALVRSAAGYAALGRAFLGRAGA